MFRIIKKLFIYIRAWDYGLHLHMNDTHLDSWLLCLYAIVHVYLFKLIYALKGLEMVI